MSITLQDVKNTYRVMTTGNLLRAKADTVTLCSTAESLALVYQSVRMMCMRYVTIYNIPTEYPYRKACREEGFHVSS